MTGRTVLSVVFSGLVGLVACLCSCSSASDITDLRLAAEQGDINAQNRLGMMYFHGEGVPADHVKAYTWLDLGVARLFGGFLRDTYVMLRNAIAVSMTSDQLAEARRRVRDWQPSSEPVGDKPPCQQAAASSS